MGGLALRGAQGLFEGVREGRGLLGASMTGPCVSHPAAATGGVAPSGLNSARIEILLWREGGQIPRYRVSLDNPHLIVA